MDRRTLGGWLSGPGSGLPVEDQSYRGQRLGLPESGPGSISGPGRRLAAITVDWFAAVLISRLIFPGVNYATQGSSWRVLATFGVMITVLVWLSGASLGQRLLGIRVVSLGRTGRVGLGAAVLRTALLCLVIPAVVFDRDQRGLHDRAARTVVVRAGAVTAKV